ncbi:DUF1360 domain-containing protein [Calidifontibacillus oryziterrae]|uniref:DUF1360 domain-containing protein n=1 Tax=Calidifontibacillus oryziterrae TaxID=1191699 RepID=UPI0002E70512|nr:DUF1360 domain-containing protein [Calidifontibacillus oryziterrae]
MISSVLDFILICLATFRLTRFFVYDKLASVIRKPFHHEYEIILDDGTIETYFEVRGKGLRKIFGELLSCYWCTGIWCAIILYCGYFFLPIYSSPVIIILAIAGSASFFEALLQKMIDSEN